MIGMNAIFFIARLLTIISNKVVIGPHIHGTSSFIESPNPAFKTPIAIISFVVYAIFAYGGMENLGGVTDSMKNPAKTFPRGLVIG